ncbi:MAG: DUF1189 family protein [Planctomycetota bacterium]
MRRYGIFHPFLLSLYSGELYRDVAQRWRGGRATALLMGYLGLLLGASLLPTLRQIHEKLAGFVERIPPEIVRDFPEILIERGILSIDRPVPYVIEAPVPGDPGRKTPFILFDTASEVPPLEKTEARVVVTRSAVHFRKNGDWETQSLAGVEAYSFGKNKLAFWLFLLRHSTAQFAILLLFWYGYRMTAVLCYALVGLIYCEVRLVNLNYPALVRLSILASTPAVLLSTVRNALSLSFLPTGLWWILCMAITLLYLRFGIRSNLGAIPTEDIGPPLKETEPPRPDAG